MTEELPWAEMVRRAGVTDTTEPDAPRIQRFRSEMYRVACQTLGERNARFFIRKWHIPFLRELPCLWCKSKWFPVHPNQRGRPKECCGLAGCENSLKEARERQRAGRSADSRLQKRLKEFSRLTKARYEDPVRNLYVVRDLPASALLPATAQVSGDSGIDDDTEFRRRINELSAGERGVADWLQKPSVRAWESEGFDLLEPEPDFELWAYDILIAATRTVYLTTREQAALHYREEREKKARAREVQKTERDKRRLKLVKQEWNRIVGTSA